MSETNKVKYSAWSIFFAIIFIVLLIMLGERAWGDLNKFFNPHFAVCDKAIEFRGLTHVKSVAPNCNPQVYEASRLVFHIALVVPLLFIQQLIYYYTAGKETQAHNRIISRSYFIFLLWMTLHLFIEITLMLFRYFSQFGFYVIVGFSALVIALLVILIQRRYNERLAKKHKA